MIVDQAVYRDGRRQECGDLGEELAALRADGASPNDFLWIGLKDPTQEELARVVAALDLHPLAVEAFLLGNARAKVQVYGSTVLAVVTTVRYLEETSDIETGRITAIIGDHVVVSLRHGDLAPLHTVRDRLERHERELLREGPLSVLHGLLEKVLETYQEVDEEVARDLEEIERDVFGGPDTANSTTIYKLKREVLEFRRAAVPLLLPLQQLAEKDGMVHSKELRLQFRDTHGHLAAVLADLDSYDTLLSEALATHLSQIGVQQNSDMRKISAWAAMIAVPTLVAGIYGMNFDVMPELHWTFGYPLALAVMALAVLVLRHTFKRSGWL